MARVGVTAGLLAVLASSGLAAPQPTLAADQTAEQTLAQGGNPFPVHLQRPPLAKLSAMAQLGQQIFTDASLSGSGKLSCATCHRPDHHYGPPDAAPSMFGGRFMSDQGVRAVPSLTYLERQPAFSVGPDNDENEDVLPARLTALILGTAQQSNRPSKSAADTARSATTLVPQGGLFWDGRADTLQDQALTPLLNPLEMAAKNVDTVVAQLRRPTYGQRFTALFGKTVLDTPRLLLAEAMFAVARYQTEEPAFHPYTSKFDAWLEGTTSLSSAEMRGYLLFNDPAKANCGGCHVDRPSPDGTPPLVTDHQFEALGAPRNSALHVNADPGYFDLGLCGPYREDLRAETQYCGMFLTPTLRNVATRQVFFHNGVFHTLRQVLDFYAFRDVAPEKIYPRNPDGEVAKYDDLPAAYRANVDTRDPPFDRVLGTLPAMTEQDELDIIAFLQTLTDGYQAAKP